MGKRRPPTFLMRTASLIIAVLIFIGIVKLVFAFAMPLWLAAVLLSVLFVVWVVGIEFGVIPYMIERSVEKGHGSESILFDQDQESKRDFEALEKDSVDNPTIR